MTICRLLAAWPVQLYDPKDTVMGEGIPFHVNFSYEPIRGNLRARGLPCPCC
jgi:hypothetical protein